MTALPLSQVPTSTFNPIAILILICGIALFGLFYIKKRNDAHKAETDAYQAAVKAQAEAGTLDLSQVDASLVDVAALSSVLQTAQRTLAAAAPAFVSSASATVSGGEILLTGVEENIAAMVIAIVCDTVGGDPAALRFVSIKAL